MSSVNLSEHCLMCNSKYAADDDHCLLLIQGMGETQFCDSCFGSAMSHMTVTPPLRYLLAIPLSKKSKAERMTMDTNHIEEFKTWCKEHTTGDIPYRFGIYCSNSWPENERKEWMAKPHVADHMEMDEANDYDHGKDIMFYWPSGGREDYMYVIKSYQDWDPEVGHDNFNLWTFQQATMTIQPTLWKECIAEMDAEIGILQSAKKRILTLQQTYTTTTTTKKSKMK